MDRQDIMREAIERWSRFLHSDDEQTRDWAVARLARIERNLGRIEAHGTAWLTVTQARPDWAPPRCQCCDDELPNGSAMVWRPRDRLRVCVECARLQGFTIKPSRKYLDAFGEPPAELTEPLEAPAETQEAGM